MTHRPAPHQSDTHTQTYLRLQCQEKEILHLRNELKVKLFENRREGHFEFQRGQRLPDAVAPARAEGNEELLEFRRVRIALGPPLGQEQVRLAELDAPEHREDAHADERPFRQRDGVGHDDVRGEFPVRADRRDGPQPHGFFDDVAEVRQLRQLTKGRVCVDKW